jgi:hypothetical protein
VSRALEAMALEAVASACREQALTLPQDSTIRAHLLRSATDYAVAAKLESRGALLEAVR